MTEQSIIGRWSPALECVGNRHYWKLIVMLPGEPCNCGSYAYQPDESDGYRELVRERKKEIWMRDRLIDILEFVTYIFMWSAILALPASILFMLIMGMIEG